MEDLRNEWGNNVQVSMQVKTMPEVTNIYIYVFIYRYIYKVYFFTIFGGNTTATVTMTSSKGEFPRCAGTERSIL